MEMIHDLGVFRPKLTTERGVALAWRNFVRRATGLPLTTTEVLPAFMKDFTVRPPEWHEYRGTELRDKQWHHDMSGLRGVVMVVWATEHGTLAAPSAQDTNAPNGPIVECLPWHVYLFNNDEYVHKGPKLPQDQKRWFARHYIDGKRHAAVLNSINSNKEN